jgi:Taurine catabolism dioxygenase TauD, TfdA family
LVGRRVPVLSRSDHGNIAINWNYYRVLHEGNPEVASFRERFRDFLQWHIVEAGRTVPLQISPGEVILFRDQRVLHGRNAFTPSPRCIWKASVKLHAP